MKQYFFLLLFFTFFSIYSSLEDLCNIKIEAINYTCLGLDSLYYYVHNKFCKIMNFKINTKKENDQLTVKILFFDDGYKDFLLKDKSEELHNSNEYYIRIKNEKNIFYQPYSIKKIVPTLKDEIIFGKEYIPFGNLFEIVFNIDQTKLDYTLELFQEKKLINIII